MGRVWGMTADHVTDVQFGHFVSAEVESAHTMRLQGGNQGGTLVSALHLHAYKDHGLFRMRIPIIEFGNVAGPQQTTEGFEAARPLWDDGRQHRLTLFPKLGAFGDMAQTVEVHIGPGSDGDQGGIVEFLPGHIRFDSSNAERPGWL